jgi:hypothetical protein
LDEEEYLFAKICFSVEDPKCTVAFAKVETGWYCNVLGWIPKVLGQFSCMS